MAQGISFPSTGDVGQKRSLSPAQELALEALVPTAAVLGTALGGPLGGAVAAGVAGVGKIALARWAGRGSLASETLGATVDAGLSLAGIGAARLVGKAGTVIRRFSAVPAIAGLGKKAMQLLGIGALFKVASEMMDDGGGRSSEPSASAAGGGTRIVPPDVTAPNVGGGKVVVPSRPLPDTPSQGRTPDTDVPAMVLPRFTMDVQALPVPFYVPDALRTSATQVPPAALQLWGAPVLPKRSVRDLWGRITKAYPAALTVAQNQMRVWQDQSEIKQPVTPPKMVKPWTNVPRPPLNVRIRVDLPPEVVPVIARQWAMSTSKPLLSFIQTHMRTFVKKPWDIPNAGVEVRAATVSGSSEPSR